jgi:hypothetical protein
LSERDVCADHGVIVNENIAKMIDPKPRPDPNTLWKTDTRQCFHRPMQ